MKTIKLMTLISMLVASSSISYAQAGANKDKAAYGGIVQSAGGYQIEMVQGKDSIVLYILDAKQKTVSNKAVTGTVVFDFFNKTNASFKLASSSKNALWVSTPKANVFTYCNVSLIIKEKTITAKFKNIHVAQSDINHGHQH